ncbi:hypothetical protein K438DRAFT_1983083 [Mycena galopus ATCC 62051]|nr:hypothetical protein K438DRAFT_1983083 [Mycena galopus ATCC 62051]
MDGAGFPPYFWESGGNERHQWYDAEHQFYELRDLTSCGALPVINPSSSSGRVRVRKVVASSTTNIPTPPVDNSAAPLDVMLVLNAVPPSSTESSGASPASPASGSNSALDLAATRRTSTPKRAQAEPSVMPSNKRRKKLDDPLDGWVMQDPDTGKELTRKEWVERYPEEF